MAETPPPPPDILSPVEKNTISYKVANHWPKETLGESQCCFVCCELVFELISTHYIPLISNITAVMVVPVLYKLSECLLYGLLDTYVRDAEDSPFSCSSVSKPPETHPPNDHCSELSTFTFLSLPLVISHFSSLVILTIDYVMQNLSLYRHVSRMTFLFVRGRK